MGGKLIVLAVFTISFCISIASSSPLWGPDGHEIVAYIAQKLITKEVASQVSTILDGQTLVEVSTWADSIKHQSGYAWSGKLLNVVYTCTC